MHKKCKTKKKIKKYNNLIKTCFHVTYLEHERLNTIFTTEVL